MSTLTESDKKKLLESSNRLSMTANCTGFAYKPALEVDAETFSQPFANLSATSAERNVPLMCVELPSDLSPLVADLHRALKASRLRRSVSSELREGFTWHHETDSILASHYPLIFLGTLVLEDFVFSRLSFFT